MNDFFERALQRYQINTAKDKQNAIYEITQQVVLAGLHRGGFFDRAAFHHALLTLSHSTTRRARHIVLRRLCEDSQFLYRLVRQHP